MLGDAVGGSLHSTSEPALLIGKYGFLFPRTPAPPCDSWMRGWSPGSRPSASLHHPPPTSWSDLWSTICPLPPWRGLLISGSSPRGTQCPCICSPGQGWGVLPISKNVPLANRCPGRPRTAWQSPVGPMCPGRPTPDPVTCHWGPSGPEPAKGWGSTGADYGATQGGLKGGCMCRGHTQPPGDAIQEASWEEATLMGAVRLLSTCRWAGEGRLGKGPGS